MPTRRLELVLGLLLSASAVAKAELVRESLTFAGEQRPYWLYLPDTYDGTQAWPLVINMHGATSNRSQQMSWSGMNDVADANQFLVVYPQALGSPPLWNDRDWGGEPDDVGYIEALIGEIESQYNVNDRRVYATGFSQGSAMSYAVGAELSDIFAAIAPISGPNTFNPTAARPLPVLLMHGTADQIAPIEGGIVPGIGTRIPPLADVLAAWQASNGCAEVAVSTPLPDTNLQDGSTVARNEYPSCGTYVTTDGRTIAAELVYYEITNGGHTWPGTSFMTDGVNRDINASEEIWAFFSRHELPQLQPGDFDGSGDLSVSDIDALEEELRSPFPRRVFDVDESNVIDLEDHRTWVKELAYTWYGDANLNGEFNTGDLVQVLEAGKYETQQYAGWSEGDWNGDGVFDTGDLVKALEDGGYEMGPREPAAVPEPGIMSLLLTAVCVLFGSARAGKRLLVLFAFSAVCVTTIGEGNQARAQINVVELTAKDIAEGYANGDFTAVDLTQAFLDRIEAFEPNYNAFISFTPNALEVAAALDTEFKTRGPRSPLHGVPIVIKESIDVVGLPSTAAYGAFSSMAGGVDLFPESDAPIVARLREAGAIILGKTNMPPFGGDRTRANASWAGPTFNVYDRTIAPGASSSGTATAVAGSLAVLGIAGETAGSLQNPAGAQGLVGIKPTFGLVPNLGVTAAPSSTRDVLGPHAKTVYDAAIALDAIAGYTPDDPKTSAAIGKLPAGGYTSALSATALEGKRIGLFGPGWRQVALSAQTRDLYDAAISVLVSEGATLIADPFAGFGFANLSPQWEFDWRGFESTVYDYEKYLERMSPNSAENALQELQQFTGVDLFGFQGVLGWATNLVPAASFNDPDLLPDLSSFMEQRARMRDVFTQVMETHHLDALVYPQMLESTPPLMSTAQIPALTVSEINILGTPGITVPAGYYPNGSPFSLVFLGESFSESALLAYAYDYEQATKHRVAPTLARLGDFDGNGLFNVLDIDALSKKVRTADLVFDVDADSRVTSADIVVWAKELANTYLGDANVDGEFNTADLVAVLQAGEYEDAIRRNSVWSEGDWDGDRDFTTSDFVLALQDGGYEMGPREDPVAVPEPSGGLLMAFASCLLFLRVHTDRKGRFLLRPINRI